MIRDCAAEIEEAALVHRCGLDAHDINRLDEAPVVIRCLAEVHRDVARAAAVACAAVVSGEMPAQPREALALGIGLDDGALAKGQARANLHVAQFAAPLCECVIECVGLADAEAEVEPVAGADDRGGLACGDHPGFLPSAHGGRAWQGAKGLPNAVATRTIRRRASAR